MKIIISPAKTIDFKSELPTDRATLPPFPAITATINRKLSRISKKKLAEMMSISYSLAQLNHSRYLNFEEEHNEQNSRPAVYTFAGDVYNGLDAYTIPLDNLDRLQDRLRILSGFYGILRPLDLIQPHRLEMGTSLSVGRKKNLYELWKKKVTEQLNGELEENELFVNLASKEYSKVVDTKTLRGSIVTPSFKNSFHGELKVISFFAKKARGEMARYLIDNDIQSREGIKDFVSEDYRFNKAASTENELVFTP